MSVRRLWTRPQTERSRRIKTPHGRRTVDVYSQKTPCGTAATQVTSVRGRGSEGSCWTATSRTRRALARWFREHDHAGTENRSSSCKHAMLSVLIHIEHTDEPTSGNKRRTWQNGDRRTQKRWLTRTMQRLYRNKSTRAKKSGTRRWFNERLLRTYKNTPPEGIVSCDKNYRRLLCNSWRLCLGHYPFTHESTGTGYSTFTKPHSGRNICMLPLCFSGMPFVEYSSNSR